jgi:hypothetical protein
MWNSLRTVARTEIFGSFSSASVSAEPLREAPSGFLKAESTVEGVCLFSPLGCGQEDETATAPTRLLLHRGDERLADPTPTVSLIELSH